MIGILRKINYWAISLPILFPLLISCSQIVSPESSLTQTNSITGVVQLARVSGATIRAYEMLEDGSKGELLAETTTNPNGEYTLSISKTISHVIIESIGGTYLDEATSQEKTAVTLSAVVDASAASNAPLTPMSTLVKERAIALLASSDSIEEAKTQALGDVARIFGVTPDDIEAIPTSPTAVSSSNKNETRAALGLAAFSYLMKDFQYAGNSVTLEDAIEALRDDLVDDGIANGSTSSALAKKLGMEWKDLLEGGRTQAAANSNLVFSKLSSDVLSEVASTMIDTGSSLDGLQEDGSFYVNGVNTGLYLGNGHFIDKYYSDGTDIGDYDSDSNTVTISSATGLNVSYSGDANIVLNCLYSDPEFMTFSGNVVTTGDVVLNNPGGVECNFRGTMTAGNVVINWSYVNEANLVSENVLFNRGYLYKGTITGNLTFTNMSWMEGGPLVTGDATFNDTSSNEGTVSGNATFNDTSSNNGTVTGNATFNDDSRNNGSVANATYHGYNGALDSNYYIGGELTTLDDSGSGVWGNNFYFNRTDVGDINQQGQIVISEDLPSDFSYFDNSGNANIVFTNGAVFPEDANLSISGGVVGFENGATNRGNITADIASFNGSSINYGTCGCATTTFNGSSENRGTITTTYDPVTFNDTAKNYGTITGNSLFFRSSENHGTLTGGAMFGDVSKNGADGTIVGNAEFDWRSSNYGLVQSNADFWFEASNHGTVTGTGSFFEDSTNSGTVGTMSCDNGNTICLGCVDSDGDGYGLNCSLGPDCNDSNSQLNTSCNIE
jgi:hypothetical protein